MCQVCGWVFNNHHGFPLMHTSWMALAISHPLHPPTPRETVTSMFF